MSEAMPWVGLAAGFLDLVGAAWAYDRVMDAYARRSRPRDADDDRAKARRRGTSGAAFALQQVFDPGVEHVIRAERDADYEDDDADPGDGDGPDLTPGQAEADLIAALGRVPIDPEEVRRLLASARRAGLDWRSAYDRAVGQTLADRPYLAPALPPAGRVAPREATESGPLG